MPARARRIVAISMLGVIAASVVAMTTPARAATQCLSGVPMIVPIVASSLASGIFSWTSDCGQSSGTWSASALGGTFTVGTSSGPLEGRWVNGSGGGTFDYGVGSSDIASGSWTSTSYGGSFDYSCRACGHVTGGWSSFGSVGGSYHYSCYRCDEVNAYWSLSGQGGSFRASCKSCGTVSGSWMGSGTVATPTPVPTPTPTGPAVTPATCASSVGPGIPPPASVPAGIEGLHAAWYGQSGHPALCPGDRVTITVAYVNSGSIGWGGSTAAALGTWEPEPGQDRPSPLGGNGTQGAPNTGWPAHNRAAAQPASYVGPGQVAWFQIALQAPATRGTYRLAVRPVIEGIQWLEDYGVFVYVTVR